jgi:hypothetical protein
MSIAKRTKMHPNAYLKAFWRTETLDQIFVAMSFESRFEDRFNNVIKPAIESEPVQGKQLRAHRVDNSKTGDSILTEIIHGIAHSRLILADVSVIDEGRYTQVPIRNANVMYEVGIALACRSPSDCLIVRDDTKKLLFDVSSIPHMTIDFSDEHTAQQQLRQAIEARLSESDLTSDARIRIAAQTLTQAEIVILNVLAKLGPNESSGLTHPNSGQVSIPIAQGIQSLFEKGCIKAVGVQDDTGIVQYALNPFGCALAQHAKTSLPRLKLKPSTEQTEQKNKRDRSKDP